METIMKKASWAAALLLVILMVLGLGCASDKGGGTGGGGNTGVGSVQIIMLSDTVSFLPGDSCAVYGFVVVKDLNGVVMRGIKVDFLLSQPFGFIEYANQSLRDTTNDVGRVEFYFRSYNQAGIQTISATAGGRSDSWLLVVLQQSQVVATLNVTVDRDAVDVAPQFEDSIMVTVTVADSSHNGVPNLVVHLSATGGRLRPIAPTDSTGRAVTYWYTNGQYGTFTIWARVSYLTDSVLVTVDSLPDIRGTLHRPLCNGGPSHGCAQQSVRRGGDQRHRVVRHSPSGVGDFLWDYRQPRAGASVLLRDGDSVSRHAGFGYRCGTLRPLEPQGYRPNLY
jgi:hypothetical protein